MNGLVKSATKVKKPERKIGSVCERNAIQFNNKWKSTDLIITVVLRNCFDLFIIIVITFFIFIYLFTYLFIYYLFIYLVLYLFYLFIYLFINREFFYLVVF